MATVIIPTSSAEHIGAKLKALGAGVMFLDKNKDGKGVFPDGEVYARISGVGSLAGKRAVVLHSGMPGPNRGLIELFNVLRILKEPAESREAGNKKYAYTKLAKPKSVEVFFLYFPYGMQDKIFQTGEAGMAEHLMDILTKYYGVKRIYAIDLHSSEAEWLNKYPVVMLTAEAEILEALEKDGLTDVVRVAPDLGSQVRLGITGFDKKRINSFEVEMQASKKIDVGGKVAVVWDDLIETGGTMVRAKDKLLGLGAKEVVAAATHGVMPTGVERVCGAYSRLYLSNTINVPEANVDVSGMVLEAINEGEKPKSRKSYRIG